MNPNEMEECCFSDVAPRCKNQGENTEFCDLCLKGIIAEKLSEIVECLGRMPMSPYYE